ncbi:MAG: DUF4294 domain-containing protein [Flavitalea sp.]
MNSLRKIIYPSLLISLCLLAGKPGMAQQAQDSLNIPQPELGPNDTIKVPAKIINNEIVPGNTMEWVFVQVPYPPELLKRKQEMTRLRNAVYVTYPYAVRAGYIINDINIKLALITDRSDRKKYMKTREKELKKEFGDPLTNLSVYQGKVLMKLINRQTGNNCYEILKEYKGGFNARIFQTVAFVFGTNLKQSYEPNGEDKSIENIVQEVQRLYGKR